MSHDHSGHAMHDHAAHESMASTTTATTHNHNDHSRNGDMGDMGGMGDMGDMSGSDTSHNQHSMMSMSFHLGYNEVILFDAWKISTLGGLLGSMIGIFILAALYEALKYYREYLFWKTYNSLQYRSVSNPPEKGATAEDNRVVHMVGEVIHKQPPSMLSRMHGFQTALHLVQIVLSYFLMLIFMTYNVWLCLAVVLGAGTGYFFFGWKKSVIVDVTEHCH